MITRFGPQARSATERMLLWMREPALRTRYVEYVTEAEQVVVDCLRRHDRMSTPFEARLLAVTAIGTYRVTMFTHHHNGPIELEAHLRRLLATAGAGLGESEAASTR
jgi:hypothetical protein